MLIFLQYNQNPQACFNIYTSCTVHHFTFTACSFLLRTAWIVSSRRWRKRERSRFSKGAGPPGYGPEVAEVGQKLPAREGFTNVILGENAPRRSENLGALFQTPRGQGNIPGDHNIILADMLDNPVICRVKLPVHNNHFEPVLVRGPHPPIRHQGDLESITLCYAVDFLFHGTGIGIDEDD